MGTSRPDDGFAGEPERRSSDQDVQDRIVALEAKSNAAMADQLAAIVEWDHREAWRADGARTCSDWLSYLFGWSAETARERVRMAHRLDFLPAIAEAFRSGLLSYDKVVWLTRFVTFEEDPAWADRAIGMEESEVRLEAKRRITIARDAADGRFGRRYLRIRPDRRYGGGTIWARLPETEFDVVVGALDRKAARACPEAGTFEQRRADALVEISSLALGADADKDRATVVVHVDETALRHGGNGMLAGGTAICNESVRRLGCGGRLQAVLQTTDTIVFGRTRRTVSTALFRHLRARDGTCVFPGCPNDIWLDAHHIEHWIDGGETEPDNLALLCGFHHRLMHEGGWNMFVTEEGDFLFERPNGALLFGRRNAFAMARAP